MVQDPGTLFGLETAFRKQFELCALKPGETVALLSDPRSEQASVRTAYDVASQMGATVYEIHVRSGVDDRFMQSDPFKAPGLPEALAKADLIICFFVGFFSAWEKPAREAGARILNILDVPEQLVRLQTTPEIRDAVVAGGRRLQATATVRVTNEAGTDLCWEIDKELPVVSAYGMADKPGVLAQWGQAMVACFPKEGSARGRVVVQPGDVWILPYAKRVQSQIDLTVENGHVTKVSGGMDAFTFKLTLDNAKIDENDMDPYAVSHLGWGLNPNAYWNDIIHYEGQMRYLNTSMRSYPANFLFSTGPGPRRKTRGHIDMPMNNCTIYLDGEKIIDGGRIISSDMIVDPKRTGH